MTKVKILLFSVYCCFLASCDDSQNNTNKSTQAPPTNQSIRVMTTDDIKWEQLNPARGDKSPKAATIWGDRKGKVATGFLVKFVDGFSSPPHIHNVSYRGLVIEGTIHNDDPDAEKMWMPPGSFWTQPAGEVHITAANSNQNMAYIEIDEGPYLVQPSEEAFDKGERPVNIDRANIVWLKASDTAFMEAQDISEIKVIPEIAFLWGNYQGETLNGTLLKLPVGFRGTITSQGSEFRVVVIQGALNYPMPNQDMTKKLEPGSYFSSEGEAIHPISSKLGEESLVYIRTNGKFKIIAQAPSK